MRFLCFLDNDKFSSAYCDYKEKDGKTLDRESKKRKDNFKNSLKHFEDKKLLKKFSVTKYTNGKEHVNYEVKDDHLWDKLKTYYSVIQMVI